MGRRGISRAAAAAGVAVVMLVLVGELGPFGSSAAYAGPPNCTRCADASSSGSAIDVAVVSGASDKVDGRGTPGQYGEAPGLTTWQTLEEYVTPACSSNGLNGYDAMCMAALSCPAANLVRFWVWHRVTTWQAGPPRTSDVGEWRQEPGSYCLGPDDPGITPLGVVVSRVQSGFDSLPLPAFTPQISPAPSTLVNIATRFTAGSADPVTLSTTPVPGITVTVTATPQEWHWTFGDGDSEVTTQPRTEHIYLKAQQVGARVDVVWGGTFTLPGNDEVFPVRGTATVPGETIPVDILQARAELVRD